MKSNFHPTLTALFKSMGYQSTIPLWNGSDFFSFSLFYYICVAEGCVVGGERLTQMWGFQGQDLTSHLVKAIPIFCLLLQFILQATCPQTTKWFSSLSPILQICTTAPSSYRHQCSNPDHRACVANEFHISIQVYFIVSSYPLCCLASLVLAG